MQGIEPAARLIDALANEVGGEIALESFLILERIMPLRERHGAGIEPHVEHVRYAAHQPAVRRRPGPGIDIGPM